MVLREYIPKWYAVSLQFEIQKE